MLKAYFGSCGSGLMRNIGIHRISSEYDYWTCQRVVVDVASLTVFTTLVLGCIISPSITRGVLSIRI